MKKRIRPKFSTDGKSKICEKCGISYRKLYRYSKKQWEKSKFCSNECKYVVQHPPIFFGEDNYSKRPDVAKKISDAKKGVKNPKLQGKLSHLWRGGRTSENHKIRSSIEYKKWREDVFKRDGYRCQLCNNPKKGGCLQADHIKPFSLYPDLRLDINNGRTLCIPCHKKTDTYGSRSRIY